jgi:hypothetical protein
MTDMASRSQKVTATKAINSLRMRIEQLDSLRRGAATTAGEVYKAYQYGREIEGLERRLEEMTEERKAMDMDSEPGASEIEQATMACSICGAHKALSELAEVQPKQWACTSNCDASLYAARSVSVIPHVKAQEFNLMKRADGCDGRPDVPAMARQFLNHYAYEEPRVIYCWQWSTTFASWSALVLFNDGWYGWTYPKR